MLFVGVVSCGGNRMMRQKEFNRVYLGEHEKELVEMVGQPQEVKQLQAGLREITYIERVRIGNARELFKKYIFILSKDGRVINKRVEEVSTPSIQFQF